MHVVRSQRGSQSLEQEPCLRVKEGKQMRGGEAAPRLLVSGLTKFLLEIGSVGHAEAGAVHMKSAMPVPATLVVIDRGAQGRAHALQQSLQNLQGKSAACVTISGLSEDEISEILKPGDCEVSVEDLDEEQVNRGNRIQELRRRKL